MKIEEKKKKNKHCSSITYTTGDPAFNIKMFNKHFGTDRGYFSGTIKPEAATQADTFLAASPDGANSVSLGGGESSGAGDAGAASGGEGGGSLEEAKRYVRRYYARPMNKFASNKAEIIRILIDADKKGQNCSIYTLNNLYDNNDVTKLTPKDIIYYYDDGILYDKNHVKIMDYDLMVKHEEERDNMDVDKVSNGKFIDNYSDRITELTGEDKEDEVRHRKSSEKDLVMEDVIDEEKIYAARINKEVEVPMSTKIIAQNEVEKFISNLEPEEEFTVGYINPMFFYPQLVDEFTLVKCTELIGTTGVDYIEADADDNNKARRIEISKEAEKKHADGTAVNLARQPGAREYGDASADYEVANRLVKQHRDDETVKKHGNLSTILFYPTIGQKPTVHYMLNLHDEDDYFEIDREDVIDSIIPIAEKLTANKRWSLDDLRTKIAKELASDEATISTVEFSGENRYETRSRISSGPQSNSNTVIKKPVRALYTNQIYYLSNKDKTFGAPLTESINKNIKKEEKCLEEAFECTFDDYDAYGRKLVEGKTVDDICCICGEKIDGYGNNPEPYMSAENGERCCDECNIRFVIPARLAQLDNDEEK